MLALTNRFRKRLPHRFWRRAYMLNFAVWPLTLRHGIAAGTDSDTRWGIAVYPLSTDGVAAGSAWRVLRARRAPAWVVALWTGTACAVGGELVLALALGPLAPR